MQIGIDDEFAAVWTLLSPRAAGVWPSHSWLQRKVNDPMAGLFEDSVAERIGGIDLGLVVRDGRESVPIRMPTATVELSVASVEAVPPRLAEIVDSVEIDDLVWAHHTQMAEDEPAMSPGELRRLRIAYRAAGCQHEAEVLKAMEAMK